MEDGAVELGPRPMIVYSRSLMRVSTTDMTMTTKTSSTESTMNIIRFVVIASTPLLPIIAHSFFDCKSLPVVDFCTKNAYNKLE